MTQESGYGWSPVGARLLAEYGNGAAAGSGDAGTMRFAKTWAEIKAMPSLEGLAELAVAHMRLLHAVDTFPRGGLCQGGTLKEALRRYERCWLPLLAAAHPDTGSLVPPLDVALMWHLHRLQPEAYISDCAELLRGSDGRPLQAPLHPTAAQAFAFSDGADAAGAGSAAAWARMHPGEPYWPPRPPGAATDGFRSRLRADLAAVGVRVPVLTHQLLRAAYMSRRFLNRAVDRYARFLLLRKHHLELAHPLPPLDVTLMWATHMSVSGTYDTDCRRLFGCPFLDMPGASASPWLERDASGPWRFHFTDTQRAWRQEFSKEPFLVPSSGYVPLQCPHPAEAAAGSSLLAAFEAAAPGTGAAAWRAGAHALFISWLRDPNLAVAAASAAAPAEAAAAAAAPTRAPPPPAPRPRSGGLFACFGCGAGAEEEAAAERAAAVAAAAAAAEAAAAAAAAPPPRVPLLSDAVLKQLAGGFAAFQNLPLSSSHQYWLQMSASSVPDFPMDAEDAEGAELELFGLRNDNSRRSDQGAYAIAGDYEADVGASPALMW